MARLVICDDEAHITDILSRFFREKGHEVFGTGRAEEALEQVSARGADLVITDIAMKGITGLELLKRIKATGADVPVIVTTGNPSHHSGVQALREGADDFLVKPFHLEEIAERAERALAAKRVRDENVRLAGLASLQALPEAALRGASVDEICDQALRLGARLTRGDAGWCWSAEADGRGRWRPAPETPELEDLLLSITKDTVSQTLPKAHSRGGPGGDEAWFLVQPVDVGKAVSGALVFRREKSAGEPEAADKEVSGRLASLLALCLRALKADPPASDPSAADPSAAPSKPRRKGKNGRNA